MDHSLAAFFAISVVIATPGQDTALTIFPPTLTRTSPAGIARLSRVTAGHVRWNSPHATEPSDGGSQARVIVDSVAALQASDRSRTVSTPRRRQ